MNTAFLESGYGTKSNHNFTLGISSDETVMLDFDDTDFKTVQYWSTRAMNWHDLLGFLILKSSPRCYHVVFNKHVSWAENMRVVAWVAYLSGNEGLQRWHRMQCIKMKSTLRVSSKNEKTSPRIVKRFGDQDEQIQNFLDLRDELKVIVRYFESALKRNT